MEKLDNVTSGKVSAPFCLTEASQQRISSEGWFCGMRGERVGCRELAGKQGGPQGRLEHSTHTNKVVCHRQDTLKKINRVIWWEAAGKRARLTSKVREGLSEDVAFVQT